jgi:hypothetical protein
VAEAGTRLRQPRHARGCILCATRKEFRAVEGGANFELFLPAHLSRLPDELHLEVRRRSHRIEAYWNGCLGHLTGRVRPRARDGRQGYVPAPRRPGVLLLGDAASPVLHAGGAGRRLGRRPRSDRWDRRRGSRSVSCPASSDLLRTLGSVRGRCGKQADPDAEGCATGSATLRFVTRITGVRSGK